MSGGGPGCGTADGSLGLGASNLLTSGDALLMELASGTLGAMAAAALPAALLTSLPAASPAFLMSLPLPLPAFSASSRSLSVLLSRCRKPFCCSPA